MLVAICAQPYGAIFTIVAIRDKIEILLSETRKTKLRRGYRSKTIQCFILHIAEALILRTITSCVSPNEESPKFREFRFTEPFVRSFYFNGGEG